MIDFESLAEKRAKELGQGEREWVEALMQPSFNEFSTYLTDGEIDEFVNGVDSPVTLTLISGSFLKGYREGNENAYPDFQEILRDSSVSIKEGLDFIYQTLISEKNQGVKLDYRGKLESLKKHVQKNSIGL